MPPFCSLTTPPIQAAGAGERGARRATEDHGTALATTSKETRQRTLLYCDRCTRVRAGAQAATRHTPRLRRGHEHRATVTRVFFRRGQGHEGKLGVIACFLFLVEHIPLGSKQLFNLLGRGIWVLSDNLQTQERCDRKAGRPNSHNAAHGPWLLSTWCSHFHVMELRPIKASNKK